MNKILFLLFFAFVFFACSDAENTSASTNSIDSTNVVALIDNNKSQQNWQEKPFDHIEIPFREFNYNEKKGLRFEMETGTVVDIPANAFEDKTGKPVTENVTVKYREFHSVTDIILSGIKMKYNEGDTTDGNFESAGMFELRAFKGDEELQLKKDKSIRVDLASFKPGDFSHYQMNEGTNDWEFIEKKNSRPNTNKQKKIEILEQQSEELKSVCLIEPLAYTDKMEVFDLDYDLKRFSEMTFVNEAMWISVGNEKEKNELRHSLSGFDDMELIPTDSCNVFQLSVWKKDGINPVKNKKVFLVKPVWTGQALKRVKKNYTNNINLLKKITDERNVAEREADLWRSFELKGMGVFNCDRVMDFVKAIAVGLVVTFKDKIKSFFYITNNGSVAIKYYEPYLENFKFNPNSTNSIIAILPDNKIGIVSESEFAEAFKKYQSNTSSDKKLEVELKSDNIPVANKKEFEQHAPKF